jgi:hypothetical protein
MFVTCTTAPPRDRRGAVDSAVLRIVGRPAWWRRSVRTATPAMIENQLREKKVEALAADSPALAAACYPTWQCENADWSYATFITAVASRRQAYRATPGSGLPGKPGGMV